LLSIWLLLEVVAVVVTMVQVEAQAVCFKATLAFQVDRLIQSQLAVVALVLALAMEQTEQILFLAQ
jgi:hypothetical protein